MKFSKKIPYYGKYNSINSIEISEDNNSYLVRRYDSNGKIRDDIFSVPKKGKNKELLVKDYYSDVDEYLIKNKKKYDSIVKEGNLLKFNISQGIIERGMKTAGISISVSAILVALSFYLPSAVMLYYVGSFMLVTSGVGVLLVNDLSKEVKKKNFVNGYEDFKDDLKSYQISLESKNKNIRTSYNGLNKDKNNGNSLKMKKVRSIDNKIA